VLTLRDLHALHLLSLLSYLPRSVDNNRAGLAGA